MDVTALASRLASNLLDDKLIAPSVKVLAPPASRPTSALAGERLENREHVSFLKIVDTGAGAKVTEKKGGGLAGAMPPQRFKRPQRGVVGRTRASMVERKLLMVKNLHGGLPQSRLGLLSANATDYRTHSWEDTHCRLDETSAVWGELAEGEKIDMGIKHKEKENKHEGPRILCLLQDLLSVEECQLPDQPSHLFCFRFNFDGGPILFAAKSEQDRASWVRTAQLFGESAQIAALGAESIKSSEVVRRAREVARTKLAAARQVEAARRKCDESVESGGNTSPPLTVSHLDKPPRTKSALEGSQDDSDRANHASKRPRPRPSSAFAGALSLPLDLALQEDRTSFVRPASAMARAAMPVSEPRSLTRPASAMARGAAHRDVS